MHIYTFKITSTLLFDGADFFRAIGDPNQISPFIIIGVIIIYLIYKFSVAAVEGNKQRQKQEEKIKQKT